MRDLTSALVLSAAIIVVILVVGRVVNREQIQRQAAVVTDCQPEKPR